MSISIWGQQENFRKILHCPYNERYEFIEKIRLYEMGASLLSKDSLQFIAKIDSLLKFAKKNNDRYLELESLFLKASIAWHIYPDDSLINTANFNKIIALTRKYGYPKLEVRAYTFLGQYYWERLKKYEQSMEYLWQAETIMKQIETEEYYDKAVNLYFLGEKYFYFSDYKKALQVFREAISVPENTMNTNYYNNSLNTIALCYRHLEQFDSSSYYLNILTTKKYRFGAEVWKDIAIGNIGSNFYHQKHYDKAFPLIYKADEAAVKRGDSYYASGTKIRLADIYIRRGQPDSAEKHIKDAFRFIKMSEKYDYYALLYPVVLRWNIAKGYNDSAAFYLDTAIEAIKAYNSRYNGVQLHKANQRINVMQREAERMEMITQRLKAVNRRNRIIIVLILTTLSLIGAYYISRRRMAEKIKIQEHHLAQAQKYLKKAQEQLGDFTRRITEKNKLIENLKKSKDDNDSEMERSLDRLKNSVILTGEDWLEFRKLFENANPGLISRLTAKYPQLSDSELRYILLSFLQFSHKEMAAILGISPDSLRVTWYRLRKKLEIVTPVSVRDFLASLMV